MNGKIGLFVNSMVGYHEHVIRGVQEQAQREGLELEIFDSGHTAVKQAYDLARFSSANPGKRLCAFVSPEADLPGSGDPQSHPTAQLARRVLQKGTGVIFLNHGHEGLVLPLRAAFPNLPLGLMTIDNVEFGRVQGRQLRALLPGGGTVLCVRGNPLESASADRTLGLKEETQRTGLAIEEIDGRWTTEVAEAATYKWVTSPLRQKKPLHAVVAQNDHMGRGARTALDRAATELARPELRRIPVLGGDGLPGLGLAWVEQGILTATVCVTLPGPAAVNALARYWQDGTALPAVTRLPVRSQPEIAALRPEWP